VSTSRWRFLPLIFFPPIVAALFSAHPGTLD
jgi:hypothetical protein